MSYKQSRLTDKEAELIQAIRNYKRSYPNGALNLYHYAQEIFSRANGNLLNLNRPS